MKRGKNAESRLVYSTESGGMCPECGKPLKKCRCGKKGPSPVKKDGDIRVSLETKGRKGKGVTLVSGAELEDSELKQLGRRLKARCGSGGTVKNGVIEIQGDHRETLLEELKKEGYKARLSSS